MAWGDAGPFSLTLRIVWQTDLVRLQPHGELVLVYNDHLNPNKARIPSLAPHHSKWLMLGSVTLTPHVHSPTAFVFFYHNLGSSE
jgi:hypothetical protein